MIAKPGARIFLLLVVAGLVACAPTGAAPPAAQPAPSVSEVTAASTDWDRIVAEARREGEVIVWNGPGEDARRHNKDAFEAAYPGIKVTLAQLGGPERDARLLQE